MGACRLGSASGCVGDDSALMIPSQAKMGELDEAWAAALSEAEHRARLAGRKDVAEYLSLRNSNDLIRQAGVDWLIAGFTTLAGDANRAGASIQISKKEGHRFPIGTSTMVGHLLTLTSGVRTLSIEAGWPRTPRDGFVRGGWSRVRKHSSHGNKNCERRAAAFEVNHRCARLEIPVKETLAHPRV